MSQKREFIEKATRRGANISALCGEYGISRQTGYKWLHRFRSQGVLGLVDRSRRPRCSPLATAEDIVVGIVRLRERHPSWGPNIICRVLGRELGELGPSASTVARVLRRLGKVKQRRRIRTWSSAEAKPCIEVHAPNDLWTIDFKGWWRAGNGERCEPFTVRDAFSRYVLAVELVAGTTTTNVRRILERLFRKHGIPLVILSDRGSPFHCSLSRGGLTHLAVWLLSLGIRLVFSRRGCPQDNGGHERMHRDVSELQLRPARNRRAQQRACDSWLLDFNHVRPHEALAGKTPVEVYRNSSRRSLIPVVPNYPPEWQTRRADRHGRIRLDGEPILVGAALAGQIVGLHPDDEVRWRVRYFDVDLGIIESLPANRVLAGAIALPTPGRKPRLSTKVSAQ